MQILITGGCGFVGSSMATYLRNRYPAYDITAFDNLKRRGSELNMRRLADLGIRFIHGDIRNESDLLSAGRPDIIIEASAEPSVLQGIESNPAYTVDTNLGGTIHALNLAKKCGSIFIFLSSSRIYPVEELKKIKITEGGSRFEISPDQHTAGVSSGGINEDFPLAGYRSMYGATKLASELMITEYNHFFDVPAVINRCGVLAGPWQMGKIDQGFIVLWMAKHFWNQNLSYIGFGGTGKQVRDVLHILDLCQLVDQQIHNPGLFNGQTFNVGGGLANSVSLVELTGICQKLTGNSIAIKPVVEDRQADIPVYITDNSRIKKLSGWHPERGIQPLCEEVFLWIKENEKVLAPILK